MSVLGTLGNIFDYVGTALNLPEWGVSEAVAQGPTAFTGRQTVGYENLQPASYSYNPPKSGGGGGSVPSGGGSSGRVAGVQTQSNQPDYYMSSPQDTGPNWDEMASSAYGDLMGGLEAIEKAYKDEYPVTRQEITTGYEQAKPPLEEAQAKQLGQLGERKTEEATREDTAISKARQLYNELRQQRMAELSAQGLSSSSVAEAQMERLGRAVYGDISDARTVAADTYRKIEKEMSNVRDFFTRKLAELEENKALALEQARVKFNSGLAQIAAMKGKAGADFKMQQAQMRYDSMQRLRQESMQIQQYNSQMRLELEKWAAAKQQALEASRQKAYTDVQFLPMSQDQLGKISGMGLSVTGYQPKFSGGTAYYYPEIGKEESEDPFQEGT